MAEQVPRALRANVDLGVDTGEGAPALRVHANALLLREAVLNLIDNAIKYSPAGGQVRLALTPADEGWRIEVSDQGPGIPAGMEARVFDTFTRLEGSDRSKTGTGLGLAIVKAFAEAMGLSVSARTVADPAGACFTLHIPQSLILTDIMEKDIA